MKKFVYFCFFVLLCLKGVCTVPLLSSTPTTLLDHMIEVNAEWRTLAPQLAELNKEVSFATETERIATHLRLVSQTLLKNTPKALTSKQLGNRMRLLDVLNTYWQAGQFPTNHFHNNRQPYFVDNYGVHCAVGYLLHRDGADALVARIRANNNFGYVRDLATQFDEIGAWATENGFTVAELAWIQPGYPPSPVIVHQVGDGSGCNGHINTMKVANGKLYIGGSFSTIGGVAANNIASWDGTTIEPLGAGVNGEVFDIAHRYFSDLEITVVGNFTVGGNPDAQNIAKWDNTNWTPLQIGDMQGTIYTICVAGGFSDIFIGGDFQKVNGQSGYKNLAVYEHSFQPPNGIVGEWTNFSKAFSTDGIVRSIEGDNGLILVGGSYTHTAPDYVGTSYTPMESKNLTYWDVYNTDWIGGFQGEYTDIYATAIKDGYLYAGGDFTQGNGYARLAAGLWAYNYDMGMYGMNDQIVHGFVKHNETLYTYGGIGFSPIMMGTWGYGLVFANGGGILTTDGTVTAAASYNDEVYMAGSFTNISGELVNGLASSPLTSIVGTTEIESSSSLKIYPNPTADMAYIQCQITDSAPVSIEIYNNIGQQISQLSSTYSAGNHTIEVPTTSLNAGVYSVVLRQSKGIQTARIVVAK